MPAADFIAQYLPHAPHYGLYVRPDLPSDKISRALRSYATDVKHDDVIALYDATLVNSGSYGAVFLPERVVFRNSRLSGTQVFSYDDVIGVRSRRKLLGGRELQVDVNRGAASVTLDMDFSGKPDAAQFVERLLKEIMMVGLPSGAVPRGTTGTTDVAAVERALKDLVRKGSLSEEDFKRITDMLKTH